MKIFPTSGFQVSRLACKKIKSHHSTLQTSEKVNGKINRAWALSEKWSHGAKALPPKLERQADRLTVYWSRDEGIETGLWIGKADCNWQVARFSVWANLGVKNFRRTQSHCKTSWNQPPGAWPSSHSQYQGKSSWASSRKKRNHFEIHQNTLFLTRLALRGN